MVEALRRGAECPLRELKISNNRISDSGARRLAEVLASDACKLRSLTLGTGGGINASSAKVIAAAISSRRGPGGLWQCQGPPAVERAVRGRVACRRRWATLHVACRLLACHSRAVITANHPLRKRARGEFEVDADDDDEDPFAELQRPCAPPWPIA